MTSPDASHWEAWHQPYDEPGSYLARRLLAVQGCLRDALDAQQPGTIRLVSLCAGQGRDVIGVLHDHPRRADVRARLVELDEQNAAFARTSATRAGLTDVEVVCGDASVTDSFEGAVPAEIVLVCGVFGNIVDADIEQTISLLPQFCAPRATVIWTRHRGDPDLTPTIRGWFEAHEFDELAFIAPDDVLFGVGLNRFRGDPRPLRRGTKLFEFVPR